MKALRLIIRSLRYELIAWLAGKDAIAINLTVVDGGIVNDGPCFTSNVKVIGATGAAFTYRVRDLA